MQHVNQTALLSSGFSSAGSFFVTPENLWQATVVFTVRRLIKPTWLNDRDQFLQPNQTLPDDFINDCLIWMLFNRCNKTASANDLDWNGQKWSIVNHFIPFTEAELGAAERFESDFMVQYLAERSELSPFSQEANAVLNTGKQLWQTYFSRIDDRKTRETLKLNRPDVGWYQIRKALEIRNAEGIGEPIPFTDFKTAYETLSEKLRPLVFEYGFMLA